MKHVIKVEGDTIEGHVKAIMVVEAADEYEAQNEAIKFFKKHYKGTVTAIERYWPLRDYDTGVLMSLAVIYNKTPKYTRFYLKL